MQPLSAAMNGLRYQIYKFIPPDQHQLLTETDDPALAEFRVYQLNAELAPEEKQKGVFHYRWLRLDAA